LEDSQLPSLYAEFVVQDRLEADWKKRKAEGGDEDGQQEALIHRKFLGMTVLISVESFKYTVYSLQ
jgi:hypothetical protein